MVQRVRKLAVKLLMILLVVCCVIGFALAFTGCSGETKGISSFTINANGELVVTYTDNTSETLGKVTADAGEDGRGITKAEINENGELVITYSDGTSENLGSVEGATGATGTGIESITLSEDGKSLVITLTDPDADPITVAIPDFSCDHEAMWEAGEYDIVELGTHTRTVVDGVETFTKTSYIVTYHCNGGHDADSDAGHTELFVNVDPIHNSNTLTSNYVPATCEEGAYTGDTCDCGYAANKVYDEANPALGHEWGETYLSNIEQLPICTHGAFVAQKCGRLFHEDGTLHTADCDCGLTADKLTSDEATRVVGTIDPIGHHASAYTITKIPTYTTTGLAEGVCMYCGEKFETELPTIYQLGIIDTRNYRLDEIVQARTYCTDPGEEVYTVYLEATSKVYEVKLAEGVEIPEEELPLTVDLSEEIPVVEQQFTLDIAAGEHILNGVGLSSLLYEKKHTDKDAWDYNPAYEGAIDQNTPGIMLNTDSLANCGTGKLGEAMFVCENPNCGINNETGEYGEWWDEVYGGVTVPVNTYLDHVWSDETRVSTTPADDGCIGGIEHYCTVCKQWVKEENAGHKYEYELVLVSSENGAYTFDVVGTCTVEGCTEANTNHTKVIADNITEATSDGKLTHVVTTAPTCYSEGTWTFTYKDAAAKIEVTCQVIIPMTDHIFAYDGETPIYLSEILEEEGKSEADLTGYGKIEDVAKFFGVATSELSFLDITKYSDKVKDYRDWAAVCGGENGASVGLGYFYCADPACAAAHDDVTQYTIIPVWRSHVVDLDADTTTEVEGSAPTCTTGGLVQGVCTVCGQENAQMETAALGHDYVYSFEAIGTIGADGAGEYTMTVNCLRKDEAGCGFTEVSGTVVVSKVVRDEATCESDPEKKTTYTYTVKSVKDATEDAELAKLLGTLPKDFVVETDEVFHILANGALIVDGGTFTFSTDAELTAAGITEGADTKATCGPSDPTKGAGTFTCKNEDCVQKTINVVTVREHDYAEGVRTEPTCTEDGSVTATCNTCKATDTYGPEKDPTLEALGHNYVVDEENTFDATLDAAGQVVVVCDREGCDTDAVTEGAQPAKVEAVLPQIQATWFANINQAGAKIEAAIKAGYSKFEQVNVLTCGQAAQYSVEFEVKDGEDVVYTYPFTFTREPESDMHTFGNSPYYLVKHYENGLLLTSVGKFCDTCEKFVVEDGFVFVGAGVSYDEENGICYDADGKALPEYVGVLDNNALGTWNGEDALPAYTNAIADGETLTISGQYASTTNTTDNWYGFFVAVDANNNGNYAEADTDFFVRSDAWAAQFGLEKPLYGTVTGVPADMDWAAFRTLKATAEFEVEIALADDTMTVTYTLFNADGTVAYEFVHTFTGMTQDSYNLTLTLDGATVSDSGVLITRA